MIEDVLILVVGITLMLFGLQAFMTSNRRRLGSEMIKATTLMIMGIYLIYYASTNFSLGTGSSNTRLFD